jgi:phosphoribosyl-ATP pyrophosphohydrolase
MSSNHTVFQYLQSEIGEWHIKEFGDVPGKRIARKALEEAAEFMVARNAEEAADVVIVLMAWAHRNGVDLASAIVEKFAIVKARDQKAREASA